MDVVSWILVEHDLILFVECVLAPAFLHPVSGFGILDLLCPRSRPLLNLGGKVQTRGRWQRKDTRCNRLLNEGLESRERNARLDGGW